MNKKFLSLFLCGALVSGSAGMFVSCKNYDSDIASLDDRITAVEKSVSELKAQISAGAVITEMAISFSHPGAERGPEIQATLVFTQRAWSRGRQQGDNSVSPWISIGPKTLVA